jgi:predicted membrane-bound spermidine synthase
MPLLIPLAYASLGAFSMVMQTILLREFFVVAAGNEISFGIAMGAWLLGVGAGSLAGAFFSARRPSTAVAFSRLALAMCLAAPLLLAGVRGLHRLAAVPQGMLLPLAKTFVLIPALTVPFSFLGGFAFPLAARLTPLPAGKAARAMSRAYAWESFGALAGGMIYTFILVGRCRPVVIIALLALPVLAAAGVIAGKIRKVALLAAVLAVALMDLGALLGGGARALDSRLTRLRWQGMSSSELVASRDTRFQNLQLGSSSGQYSLFANGQLAAVFPDDEANELLAAQLISQHPRPRDILVIGDACAGLARQLLRFPIDSLTAVEVDRGFSELIVQHVGEADRAVLRDPRLRLLVLDGRRFAALAARHEAQGGGRYDLVFIHQPDAWTAQLNRYYTREFFQDLERALKPGGVVALRLASAENYASEIVAPYTAVIYRTLRSVFPAIAVSPGMTNFLFAAADPASVSQDPATLERRYRALAPPPAALAPVFVSLYPAEKAAFITAALDRTRTQALNLDSRPVAYFLGSRLLGWSSGTPLSGLFDRLERLAFPMALLAALALLLPATLLTLARRGRGMGTAPVLMAAFSGGCAGLSFEIVAIFMFQNIWGFVYQAVGMLIAMFMLGLGLGAAGTARWLERNAPSPRQAARLLAAAQALIAVLDLACLGLPRLRFGPGWPGQLLLAAWLGGMGVLVGSILPLGLRALGRLAAERGAGYLNAGDYLGGAIGSLFMAALFLPLMGTGNSLLLVSVLALATAGLLALAARLNGTRGRSPASR